MPDNRPNVYITIDPDFRGLGWTDDPAIADVAFNSEPPLGYLVGPGIDFGTPFSFELNQSLRIPPDERALFFGFGLPDRHPLRFPRMKYRGRRRRQLGLTRTGRLR